MDPGLLRIIDAAANRAREALRVMEDVARFALDDADLSAALKTARHEFDAAAGALAADAGGASALLAARNTPGDVGTQITTARESSRAGLRDVAAAACKRLAEALRSLEECAKVASPPGAARLEALRYRGYELERRLLTALGAGRAPQWALCVLITESLCRHHPWEDVARLAIEGGADCLQLREKTLDAGELLARARRLVAIARGRAAVIINDRPDVALLAGADGVHVGQTDLSVRDVRRLAGDRLLVGVSTSNLDQARRAAAEGADLCGVGPMFATTTKHKPVLAGPEYLRAFVAELGDRMPHLAIGGITPENIRDLAAAGCRGVAVSAAVCAAQHPAKVCRALREGLGSPTPQRG
jgi:thiamine-phosphate pyrophosphorylase